MKFYLSCLWLLMFPWALLAQQERTCGTMDYHKADTLKNPARIESLERIERFTQQWIKQHGSKRSAMIITIPVVVHVIYNNAIQNISFNQIQSQIQVLNEDFRRMNADATNTPTDFLPFAADIEIEFCLANVDPNGYQTNGITRTATDMTSFGLNDGIKFKSMGGHDAWPTSDYLNIWVGVIGGGILGYAQLPGGDPDTDGIVTDYRYFGTNGTATAPFNLGRTATHEVGHWLNLRHIWGDGGCGIDDGVADTPLAGNPNYTDAPCTYPDANTCNTGANDLPDMFQNFMDYSHDECMNLFTLGQKDRMRALFALGGVREGLLSSNGCANNGLATSCSDGVQNGEETGIDCGGSTCVACSALCNDGLLNGDEDGIDCGGSCPTCPPEEGEICTLAFPLTSNGIYAAPNLMDGFGATQPFATHAKWYVFLPLVDGTVTIHSCGGGIDTRLWLHEGCCGMLNTLVSSDDDCPLSLGNFNWASELVDFSIKKGKKYFIEWDDRWSGSGFEFSFTFTPLASCTDGVLNNDEIAIDCGGGCLF